MAMRVPGRGSDDDEDEPDVPEDAELGVKIMLFTDKDEVPGVYKALAYNFRAYEGSFFGLSFGWVQV